MNLKTFIVQLLLLLFLLILALFIVLCFVFILSEKKPCEFSETVNLSGSQKFENGSYLYEGIIVPGENVSIYDYKMNLFDKRTSVSSHTRGCICASKSFLNFCHHPENGAKEKNEQEYLSELKSKLKFVNVTRKKGENELVDISKEFIPQIVESCESTSKENKFEGWTLYENGTLGIFGEKESFNKDEYCFDTRKVNGVYFLKPVICGEERVDLPTRLISVTIISTISVPFLVLTAIVYTWIRELRNLHGKCLICYLVTLAIGNSCLIGNTWGALLRDQYFTGYFCFVIGYTAYFFFLAAFLWLSIISFDLWYRFKTMMYSDNRSNKSKRFSSYSKVAWTVSATITIITFCIQFLAGFRDPYNPEISMSVCFVNDKSLSAMIYFYDIVLLLIIFNITMFSMTILKIYKVRKEISRFSEQNAENDNFGLFLRLFFVMGISWLFEVLSYLAGVNTKIAEKISKVFYLTDWINSAQGIIIFCLFVLKPKVRMLIKNQWNSRGRFSNYGFHTGSSRINLSTRSSKTSNSKKQYTKVATADFGIAGQKSTAV